MPDDPDEAQFRKWLNRISSQLGKSPEELDSLDVEEFRHVWLEMQGKAAPRDMWKDLVVPLLLMSLLTFAVLWLAFMEGSR